MAERVSWYCGTMRAEPKIVGSRVVTYRYVPVNGCGSLNRPDAERCSGCGKRKAENARVD